MNVFGREDGKDFDFVLVGISGLLIEISKRLSLAIEYSVVSADFQKNVSEEILPVLKLYSLTPISRFK